MDRRDFIKSSCSGLCVALGSGFLLSSALSSCKAPLGIVKTSAQDNKIIIPMLEFATSDYKLVRVKNYDYDLAVRKKADGTFQTLVLVCSHAGQPLTKTGNTYYCSLHGSQFSKDGKVLKGPAERDMKQLPTTATTESVIIQLV